MICSSTPSPLFQGTAVWSAAAGESSQQPERARSSLRKAPTNTLSLKNYISFLLLVAQRNLVTEK